MSRARCVAPVTLVVRPREQTGPSIDEIVMTPQHHCCGPHTKAVITMFTRTALRFSPATALAVAAILGGGLSAAAPAGAQVPDSPSGSPSTVPTQTSRPTPTKAPTPTPTATPTATPSAPTPTPAGPGQIAAPADPGTPDPPAPAPKGPGGVAGDAPISINILKSEIGKGIKTGGGPVGWAYVVTKNGTVVAADAGGKSNVEADIDFTINTRLELMSATKSITAMAVLKALNAANVSVDTPITPFLPSEWSKGPGFAWTSQTPITFRQLLTHTSGILQVFNDPSIDKTGFSNAWDGLALLVKQGATPNVAAGEQYKNANYALLRVILPELWRMADGPKSKVTEANHGFRYVDYVNSKLMIPAGLKATSCWDGSDDIATRAYDKENVGQGGVQVEYTGNANECGGHRGLHLSALDLVKLTGRLRQTNDLMPAPVRDAMFTDRLGWKAASNLASLKTAGLWWHGGDGFFGSGREIHTCNMNAPQGLQLSIVMNSGRPGGLSQCGILKDAVNKARTAK